MTAPASADELAPGCAAAGACKLVEPRWFEAPEIEEQMQIFAEEVMPVIASECGGKVELPARGPNFVT